MLARQSLRAVEILPLFDLVLHCHIAHGLMAVPPASMCYAFKRRKASLMFLPASSIMMTSPAFCARSLRSSLRDATQRPRAPQTDAFSGISLTSGFSMAPTSSSNMVSPAVNGCRDGAPCLVVTLEPHCAHLPSHHQRPVVAIVVPENHPPTTPYALPISRPYK